MAIEDGFGMFQEIFNINFINISWIVALILTLFILIIITREYEKWTYLAYPVLLILDIINIKSGLLLWIAGIIFVIKAIDFENIVESMKAVTKFVSHTEFAERKKELKQLKEIGKKELRSKNEQRIKELTKSELGEFKNLKLNRKDLKKSSDITETIQSKLSNIKREKKNQEIRNKYKNKVKIQNIDNFVKMTEKENKDKIKKKKEEELSNKIDNWLKETKK